MPNNYVLLDRIELNATATSVTFDNIPQTGYTDLKIVATCRVGSGSGNGYGLRFNGDTASNYVARVLRNNSNAANSYSYSSTVLHEIKVATTADTANTFTNDEFYIPNYTSSNQKTTNLDSAYDVNSASYDSPLSLQAGRWSGTAAITSITMQPTSAWNFAVGSTFSLYGVAKLGTTPAIAPKANGGNVIGTDGTYWYHAFLSNGTFTPQTNFNADVLVVAGGGGGGGSSSDAVAGGGGAGAGGLVEIAQAITFNSSYAITIGAGGVSGAQGNTGGQGTNTSFASITAFGGGAGRDADDSNVSISNGGSGGGASGSAGGVAGTATQTSPSGGIGYGNNGGTKNDSNAGSFAGGGGGGAAAAASGRTPGAGRANNLTGVSVTYAAGGYGQGTSNFISAGVAGAVNTGNGGNGANNGAAAGGAGGSGIVIIRYLVA